MRHYPAPANVSEEAMGYGVGVVLGGQAGEKGKRQEA